MPKFRATVFLRDSWYQAEGDSPEQCLSVIQDQWQKDIAYKPRLTYRPSDGTIFNTPTRIPVGVVYRLI